MGLLTFPLPPLFLAIVIVSSMMLADWSGVMLYEAAAPLLALLVATAVLVALIALATRQLRRAAIIASALLLVFFSLQLVVTICYGLIGWLPTFFVWCVLFVAVPFFAARTEGDLKGETILLNVASLV